jgi:hypothetical protein
MDIYLACALTHVPRVEFDDYVEFIHTLAHSLETQVPARVRYALRHSDPQLADRPFKERARLCYLWDREMVESADVVVAEATYPSTGLGIELQIAASRSTPIVLCFNQQEEHRVRPVAYANPDHSRHQLQVGDGFVSLMALGIPSIFRVIGYSRSASDVTEITKVVGLIRNEAANSPSNLGTPTALSEGH